MNKSEYRQYRNSDAWEAYRQAWYTKNPKRCYCCDQVTKSMQLHHTTYSRLGAELLTDCVCVCYSCHAGLHELVAMRKAPLKTAHVAYREIRQKVGHRPRVAVGSLLLRGQVLSPQGEATECSYCLAEIPASTHSFVVSRDSSRACLTCQTKAVAALKGDDDFPLSVPCKRCKAEEYDSCTNPKLLTSHCKRRITDWLHWYLQECREQVAA